MKNNEHLALFVLGVGTLGITFLLLFALSDRNTASFPAAERQVSVPAAQAAVEPQPQPQTPEYNTSIEVLDRQVAETFTKAAEYLGRGTYQEEEHIALLERLEFYGGMSSINPEQKKTAQDYIKDMSRLLTLKESVARQVKLAGQISAVESDVHIHLAKGGRNKAEARKLMDRIESLYAIQGLSEDQNKKLRTSLAALKSSYKKSSGTRTASAAPAPARKAEAPKASKPSAPVVKAAVETKTEVTPKTESKPTQKAPVAATAPRKTKQPASSVTTEKYYKVMTRISQYFVEKKYNQNYHDTLTAELLEVSKAQASLSEKQQERLSQTIAKMERLDKKFRR
jgi:hypothetical protein